MKKVVLFLCAALLIVSVASCKNSTQKKAKVCGEKIECCDATKACDNSLKAADCCKDKPACDKKECSEKKGCCKDKPACDKKECGEKKADCCK